MAASSGVPLMAEFDAPTPMTELGGQSARGV